MQHIHRMLYLQIDKKLLILVKLSIHVMEIALQLPLQLLAFLRKQVAEAAQQVDEVEDGLEPVEVQVVLEYLF